MKRLLLLVLTLGIVFGTMAAINISAFAAVTTGKENEMKWSYDSSKGRLTITGTGFVNEYKSWEKKPFKNKTDLKELVIDGDFEIIDNEAFKDFTALKTVVINGKLGEIWQQVFANCTNLVSVKLPEGLKEIGTEAFYKCSNLKTINLPDSLERVDYRALGATAVFTDKKNWVDDALYIDNVLISVKDRNDKYVVRAGTKVIATFAMFGCDEITSISLPKGLAAIGQGAFEHCLKVKKFTIPSSVRRIDCEAFYDTGFYNDSTNWENDVLYCNDILISARDTIKGNCAIKPGTRLAAAQAFDDCKSLTGFSFPSSLKTVSEAMFSGCSGLKNITITDGIEYIEDSAFMSCDNLESVTFGKGLKKVGLSAFDNCEKIKKVNTTSLKNWCSIDFESYSPIINTGKFYVDNKEVKEIKVPDGVTKIGKYVFANCTQITKVTMPGTVKSIGEGSFDQCFKLKSVDLGNVESIGFGAFRTCDSLKEVKFSPKLKTIEREVFYSCGELEEADLSYVKCIRENSFAFCDLKRVIFGKLLESVEKDAFAYNTIAEIKYGGTKSDWKNIKISAGNETLGGAKKVYSFCEHTTKKTITPATADSDGKTVKKCIKCNETTSSAKIKKISSVKIDKTSYTYTGKALKPTVTVKDSDDKTISSSNYTVSYKNNTNVGKATVTITFKGNYKGTITKTFKINPKATTVSKLTAKSKGFKAEWKKQSTQTTGYEIQYSTSSKFTEKTTKKITVKDTKTVSKTISSLKAGTKYYVRIRTYKTVSKTNYYSDWSKAMTVTTKK